MAISHELSGEIAAALLSYQRRTHLEMNEVRDTLLKVHSILQEMADKDRDTQLIVRSARAKRDVAFKAGA